MTDPVVLSLVIGMIFFSAACIISLGLYGLIFARKMPVALPYSLLMLASAGWAILYACDLMASSLPEKVLFHNLRFFFLPFLPVLELWLVLTYVKRESWLTKGFAALLLAVPVLACAAALSSGYHQLFRFGFAIISSGPVGFLVYREGPVMLLLSIYSIALLLITLVILLGGAYYNRAYRRIPTLLLFIALALPTIINYLFLFGYTPVPGVNMTTALLWIPAALYTLAIFRYRLLDVIPVARDILIEIMDLPVLVLDTDGRIADLNPAASALLGAEPGRAVQSVPGGDAAGLEELRLFCAAPVIETLRQDIRIMKGGKEIFFSALSEPIRSHGDQPVGRLILLQEITYRKNAEEIQRQLIAELGKKNAELDRFAYTISHDLKSPLISIQGFAAHLESDLERNDSYQVKNDLKRILESTASMENLITTILALSRSGRSIDRPEPVAMDEVVRIAVSQLEPRLNERGVSLTTRPGLPVVTGDRARLVQVMANLLDNAVKFLGNTENPAIWIGADEERGGPVFFVRDNGIGIDPANLDRIFGLFERVPSGISGTGIGLATAKRIVEAHGGKIWAESGGPGTGTVFRFTLPGSIEPAPGSDIHKNLE